LGCRPDPEPALDAGAADRIGDAPRLGACGIYQAVDFAPARTVNGPTARRLAALPRPAIVHRGRGGWREAADEPTRDSGLGFQIASLDVGRLPPGEHVEFTWRWQENGAWQGRDYTVAMLPADVA
jgi:hypothetical protein